MARITLNPSAPAGAGTFGFGPEELDVTGGPIDTDNAAIIADADRHPWLDVDHGVVETPALVADPPEPGDSFNNDFGYGEGN